LDWFDHTVGIPDAKLTVAIPSPRPKSPVVLHREGKTVARRDSANIVQRGPPKLRRSVRRRHPMRTVRTGDAGIRPLNAPGGLQTPGEAHNHVRAIVLNAHGGRGSAHGGRRARHQEQAED
jgi:hypothetical protein